MFHKTKKLPLFMMMMFMASMSVSALADSKLGKISGYKFNDLNGNGIDDMEPRLAGVSITVTSKTGSFEDTDVTDDNGRFSFRNLPHGKYKVCETVPENYTATTPECVNVTLRGKAPHVKVRFGNQEIPEAPVGQIVGLKFHDLNENKIPDEGEPLLQNWTINITGVTNPGFSDTTTTGENGQYSFTNLPLGTYNVCEVPQTGWTATTETCFVRTLTDTVRSVRAVFGNLADGTLGQIIGLKFNDLRGNGTWEEGADPVLPDWTITLKGITNPDFEATTTTNSEGRYSFTNLPLGEYEVCEVVQTGWVATTPACVVVELTAEVLSRRALFGNKESDVVAVGCTYTQGFWKNKGEELLASLFPSGLMLGTTHVYDPDEMQSIFDQPVQGNALISLAYQLIAAEANIENGADNTTVSSTIVDAHALIAALQIPPVGSDVVNSGHPDYAAMIAAQETLDDFNNGRIGPGHCAENENED